MIFRLDDMWIDSSTVRPHWRGASDVLTKLTAFPASCARRGLGHVITQRSPDSLVHKCLQSSGCVKDVKAVTHAHDDHCDNTKNSRMLKNRLPQDSPSRDHPENHPSVTSNSLSIFDILAHQTSVGRTPYSKSLLFRHALQSRSRVVCHEFHSRTRCGLTIDRKDLST